MINSQDLSKAFAHNVMIIKRNKRKEEERIVIALEDFSYVVVLADRGEYVLLWTAYYVEQEHRRQKLRREYKAYVNEKG